VTLGKGEEVVGERGKLGSFHVVDVIPRWTLLCTLVEGRRKGVCWGKGKGKATRKSFSSALETKTYGTHQILIHQSNNGNHLNIHFKNWRFMNFLCQASLSVVTC